MATPVQFFIDAGYARSTANDPNLLALPGEIVAQVNLVVQELYVRAKEINPLYFLDSEDVDPDGAGWARPTLALNVLAVERVADEVPVHVVPFNDRFEAALPPRIYRVGATAYRSVGEALDPDPAVPPAGDTLRVWYATAHPALTAPASVLDASWPERHNDLIVLEVAKYLALKDKARGDLAGIEADLEKAYALFDADLRQVDSALEARFGRVSGYRDTQAKATA